MCCARLNESILIVWFKTGNRARTRDIHVSSIFAHEFSFFCSHFVFFCWFFFSLFLSVSSTHFIQITYSDEETIAPNPWHKVHGSMALNPFLRGYEPNVADNSTMQRSLFSSGDNGAGVFPDGRWAHQECIGFTIHHCTIRSEEQMRVCRKFYHPIQESLLPGG